MCVGIVGTFFLYITLHFVLIVNIQNIIYFLKIILSILFILLIAPSFNISVNSCYKNTRVD